MTGKINSPSTPLNNSNSQEEAFVDQVMDLLQAYMHQFNSSLDRLYRLIFKTQLNTSTHHQELIDILTQGLEEITDTLTAIVKGIETIILPDNNRQSHSSAE